MKLETQHIEDIRTDFHKMKSRYDFLQLINKVNYLLYGNKSITLSYPQLIYFPKAYLSFSLKKKSGSHRQIYAPIKSLKFLQKSIHIILQSVFEPHKAATGFVQNKSVVENAKIHQGNRYIYNLDLKDFFSSIDQARVWKTLQLPPFNLNGPKEINIFSKTWQEFLNLQKLKESQAIFKKENGKLTCQIGRFKMFTTSNFDPSKQKFVLYPEADRLLIATGVKNPILSNNVPTISRLDIAGLIAQICCTEMEVQRKNADGNWESVRRRVLPQGAPSSPMITNIICQKLDRQLTGVAHRFGLRYSRYADDITFSSMHNVYEPQSDFLNELNRIITAHGFQVQESKTRLQKPGVRQEVTGLVVNEKINVPQSYIKELRLWIYFWENFGYDKATNLFLHKYYADKGHQKSGTPILKNVIHGKLKYLKMVKGENDPTYEKLYNRFQKLRGKKKEIESKTNFPENPKHVADFMALFNQREGLKYLTHDYDENNFFEIQKFLESASLVFENVTKKINIPQSLYSIVKQFAFNSNNQLIKWTTISENYNENIDIRMGWQSKEVLDWSLKNKLHPIENESFKQMINSFKRITRIEKNNLEILVKNCLEKVYPELGKNNIELKDLNKADFYSHVGNLKKALETIFQEIKNQSAGKLENKISIECQRDYLDDYALRRIKITHYDSFANKELPVILKEWPEKGNMGKIYAKLKGYCDWSVQTIIEGENIKVNILKDALTPDFERIQEKPLGFTHILTFYYK